MFKSLLTSQLSLFILPFFLARQPSILADENIFVWVLLKATSPASDVSLSILEFLFLLHHPSTPPILPCYDKLLKIEFWRVLLWNFDGFPIPSNLVSVPTHNVNDRRFLESNIIEDDDKKYPLFSRFFLLLHNVCVCRGEIFNGLRCCFLLSLASHHFSVTARREIDFPPI